MYNVPLCVAICLINDHKNELKEHFKMKIQSKTTK